MRRLPLAVALFLFPGIAIWVERLTAGPPASYGTPPLVIDAFFQSAEYHGRFLP